MIRRDRQNCHPDMRRWHGNIAMVLLICCPVPHLNARGLAGNSATPPVAGEVVFPRYVTFAWQPVGMAGKGWRPEGLKLDPVSPTGFPIVCHTTASPRPIVGIGGSQFARQEKIGGGRLQLLSGFGYTKDATDSSLSFARDAAGQCRADVPPAITNTYRKTKWYFLSRFTPCQRRSTYGGAHSLQAVARGNRLLGG